ncbi:trypsin-like peptidase domain-containing protein [Kitasatospora sp. GP82]|uniref:VMAP-C domain-containing protein n=1 Tax=Kitasatospora sp. GP82 TaxID=3035089 RepID=UPI00247615CA|nr:trypsin-like peptidase domain-containing protein [Kitasatospora sp. GP82]
MCDETAHCPPVQGVPEQPAQPRGIPGPDRPDSADADAESARRDVTWLTRISSCGPLATAGAGVLISERRVLTCAHVVQGCTRVVVHLAARPDHPPIGATVAVRGPWGERTGGTGDVAVLELDRPLPPYIAVPARFAPLHGWNGLHAPQLAAYGFPEGHDGGLSSEIRLTRGALRIGGELVQLEHEGTGMPLAPGFSGGPVVIAATGEVVGIVTAAQDTLWRPAEDRARRPAGVPAVRLGQMLPAEAIARYAPELADRLPGAAVDRDAVRELRLLLESAEVAADPLELYRSAAGPLGCPDPPTRPRSLWEAGWYLLAEVPQPVGRVHPVLEFATIVAELVEGTELRVGLHHWRAAIADHPAARPSPVAQPYRPAPTAHLHPRPEPVHGPRREKWRPILVDIQPSGAGTRMFHVAVSTIRDGTLGEPHSRTMLSSMLPGFVRERIEEEIGQLEPDGAELIIFALPRKWLTQPVHSWARRKDFGPLGADHAVVVVDQQRRGNAADRRHLEMKWSRMREYRGAMLYPILCTAVPDSRRFYQRLRPVGRAEVPMLPSPPKGNPFEPLLAAALKAGAPAVLWPQYACTTDHAHAQTCRNTAFLARLAAELADVPPDDLPRRVRELRHQAEESDDPAGHWSAGLVLLWEDPQVVPSPHRPYGVAPTAQPPRHLAD